jgi:hypothetical protein
MARFLIFSRTRKRAGSVPHRPNLEARDDMTPMLRAQELALRSLLGTPGGVAEAVDGPDGARA